MTPTIEASKDWQTTPASELRPGDVVRGIEQPSPVLTVRVVDRFAGNIYLYFAGQPDAIVFAPGALFERAV